MQNINNKEKQFVAEYIRTLDCEKAVKYGKFKTPNPKKLGQYLLCQTHIIKEIKCQMNQQIDSLNVQKGYVIQKLLQIAEFSLTEEDILDKDRNFTGKRKLRDAGAGLKALESLCKYLGFSSPPTENKKYIDAKIITISNLDDKKI